MPSSPPLKILHLVGDHEDAGGVLSVIRNLDSVSCDEGWEHVVWVNHAYQESRKPALKYRYSRSVLAESTRHLALVRQAGPASSELVALCKEEHFDIIHAHSRGTLLVALLFAWRTKRSVIYTNHNYARGTKLYQWSAKMPRMHTVVLTANMARHYGLQIGTDRVNQISACYSDTYLKRPLATRRDLSGVKGKIKLIGVGSVIGWKKWDLVVDAIRRLSPEIQQRIEFNIWGPTLQLPEAITFAEQLKKSIESHRLGAVVRLRGSTSHVIDELCESDYFVLPSTNEPCSVALMEALALGLPVIVSDSGGNVDIVKAGCGLKFSADDPDSLKSTLEQAINEPSVFCAPEEIRQSVRERSASRVFELYRALYHDINSSS